MIALQPTLYFARVKIADPLVTPILDRYRGYPLPHLLAMHLVNVKEGESHIDFYFSTELARVKGTELENLWKALVDGDPDLDCSRVTGITIHPYTQPPSNYYDSEVA